MFKALKSVDKVCTRVTKKWLDKNAIDEKHPHYTPWQDKKRRKAAASYYRFQVVSFEIDETLTIKFGDIRYTLNIHALIHLNLYRVLLFHLQNIVNEICQKHQNEITFQQHTKHGQKRNELCHCCHKVIQTRDLETLHHTFSTKIETSQKKFNSIHKQTIKMKIENKIKKCTRGGVKNFVMMRLHQGHLPRHLHL